MGDKVDTADESVATLRLISKKWKKGETWKFPRRAWQSQYTARISLEIALLTSLRCGLPNLRC